MEVGAHGREFYGVGIDSNIVTASIKAIISSINRANEAAPVRDTAKMMVNA
jgi:2-isopropylmalate synthase